MSLAVVQLFTRLCQPSTKTTRPPGRESPRVKLAIGRREGIGIIDTGSEVSLIERQFYEKNKRDFDNVIELPCPEIRLKSASGDQIPITHCIEARIAFPGQKEKREGTFLVVNQISKADMLIGSDFMEGNQMKLDYGLRKVSFGKRTGQREKEGDSWGWTVRPEHKQLFQARTERVVLVPRPTATNCQENEVFLVECVRKPEGLTVMDGLTRSVMIQGKVQIPCIVANANEEQIEAKREDLQFKITPRKELVVRKIDQVLKEHAQQERELEKREIPKRTNATDNFVRENADLSSVPPKWKGRYVEMLQQFQDVFSRNHLDIGHCTVLPHELKLKDPNKIINIPPYRVPHHLLEVQHKYLDDLLAAKVVRASMSPFSSPLMLVKKANADPKLPLATHYRAVHNYRLLNQQVACTSYPLRNLYELVDEVARGTVFSLVDLSQGYYNQDLVGQTEATAFSVIGRGTYEYIRSPMGINSSPGYFQRMVEYVFRNLKNTYVYLDDCITSSSSHEEDLQRVKALLSRIRQYNLKINLRKAHFGKTSIEYLGYHIGPDGVSPGLRKTETIRNAPVPKTLREVRQFLGLTSFFRRCIPHFSARAKGLTRLLRKDSGYTRGPLPPEALKAYRELQTALISRPTLAPVDWKKEFFVTVDSSQVAHGCILSQNDKNGIRRPCAYASCTLDETMKRRPAYELEKRGVRWALHKFKPYLLGRHFTIEVDHLPLKKLESGHIELTDHISADIQKFQPFSVKYIPGPKHPADWISRGGHRETRAIEINTPKLTEKEKNFYDRGQNRTPGMAKETEPGPIGLRRGAGNTILSVDTLFQAQQQDSNIKALAVNLKFCKWPQDGALRSYVMANRRFYRMGADGIVEDRQGRAVVPNGLKENIMIMAHDQMGHFDAIKTIDHVSRYFTWDGMKKEVDNYCKSCPVCSQTKVPARGYTKVPLGEFPPACVFNERIHIDAITGLKPTPQGYRSILVISDAYSGYTMAKPMTTPNALEVADILYKSWLSVFGYPKMILGDSGKENDNKTLRNICDFHQIELRITSPLTSKQNGFVERRNRQLRDFLRKYVSQSRLLNWDEYLAPFMMVTNYARQKSGFSPHFLVFSSAPNLPGLNFREGNFRHSEDPWAERCRLSAESSKAVLAWREKQNQASKQQYDKNVKYPDMRPGDLVYLRVTTASTAKQFRRFSGPFLLLRKTDTQGYIKALRPNATPFYAHLDRLKRGHWRSPLLMDPSNPDPAIIRTRNQRTQSARTNEALEAAGYVDPSTFDDLQPPGPLIVGHGPHQQQPGPGQQPPRGGGHGQQDPPPAAGGARPRAGPAAGPIRPPVQPAPGPAGATGPQEARPPDTVTVDDALFDTSSDDELEALAAKDPPPPAREQRPLSAQDSSAGGGPEATASDDETSEPDEPPRSRSAQGILKRGKGPSQGTKQRRHLTEFGEELRSAVTRSRSKLMGSTLNPMHPNPENILRGRHPGARDARGASAAPTGPTRGASTAARGSNPTRGVRGRPAPRGGGPKPK